MKYIIPAHKVLDDFKKHNMFICWSVSTLIVEQYNSENPDNMLLTNVDDVSDSYFRLVVGFDFDLDITGMVLKQLFSVLDSGLIVPKFLEQALALNPEDVLEVLVDYNAAMVKDDPLNNKPLNVCRTVELLFGLEPNSVKSNTVGLTLRYGLLNRMIERGVDFEIEIDFP